MDEQLDALAVSVRTYLTDKMTELDALFENNMASLPAGEKMKVFARIQAMKSRIVRLIDNV